jgi:hypothetical protein
MGFPEKIVLDTLTCPNAGNHQGPPFPTGGREYKNTGAVFAPVFLLFWIVHRWWVRGHLAAA